MYRRNIESYLKKIYSKYRSITLIGPRQSGKTTLAKKVFPQYEYFSFENPDLASEIRLDPRGFFKRIKSSAILDEVQKIPEVLSYLQEILDDNQDKRCFILTGSNNLKLYEKISQSLAGRTRILTILPLTKNELPSDMQPKDFDKLLFKGGYPKIFKDSLNPTEWLSDYYQTYIEKDIRQVINLTSLPTFDRFLRLTAGRVGQLLNYNNLAGDCGITQPTAKSWLGALQTTYICFTLEPHFKNFKKRMTKAPKVYFYDTGLLCYLLRINNLKQLNQHPLRGHIFENWVITELIKIYFNNGQEAPLYFWRDQHGHEVDIVIDQGLFIDLIEIKSGATFQEEYLDNIKWLNNS